MSADSHRERIAATIRVSSRPLDDDEVAARAGISPRQTVNRICRSLERAGMVRRRVMLDWTAPTRAGRSWPSAGHTRDRRRALLAGTAVAGTGALAETLVPAA